MPKPHKDPIDAYLDDVCAQFIFMPATEIERNRLELRQHIEAMAEDIVAAEGETHEAATGIALVRFGEPRKVGKLISNASPVAWLWKRNGNGAPRWVAWLEVASSLPLVMFLILSKFLPKSASTHSLGLTIAIGVTFLLAGTISILCDLIRGLYNEQPSAILEQSTHSIDTIRPGAKVGIAAHIAAQAIRWAARYKAHQRGKSYTTGRAGGLKL